MASWKEELRLSDLDTEATIEIVCKRCGLARYELRDHLLMREELARAYLDEVEAALRCRVRTCGGRVRLALVHDDPSSGFVGGMA